MKSDSSFIILKRFFNRKIMGLFSFTQEIAMDLGTANTIILSNDKIVVDEPSVVALDRRTDKMIAVGERAKLMYEKENPNIRTVRPLRDGVIADFNACEQMMRGLIKKVNTGRRLFTPSLRMVIGVPSGSTEVELRAVRDSAEHAGGRDVYLIFEPMAAAIGIGLDVEAPEGNMIVDIGVVLLKLLSFHWEVSFRITLSVLPEMT